MDEKSLRCRVSGGRKLENRPLESCERPRAGSREKGRNTQRTGEGQGGSLGVKVSELRPEGGKGVFQVRGEMEWKWRVLGVGVGWGLHIQRL